MDILATAVQRCRVRHEGIKMMRRNILASLNLPRDLRGMSTKELQRLAHEVRALIIDTVSSNGGHLAPSLGVVELTIAMLSVMDVPDDKIVWDVGHQCYAYKLLTDRLNEFHTLRQAGGISGFPKPSESCYDAFAAGHASTAISAALGIAQGRDLAGDDYKVTAVVGDGALGGGMAWEAINNAGASKADLLVILNDNKMSISPSIGALATHIARLRTMPIYRTMETGAERILSNMPVGGGIIKWITRMFKRGLTHLVLPTSGTIFEALGFEYLGPIDGHDIAQLHHFIAQARSVKGPVLLHVVTKKGKGYYRAEHNARQYHGVGPFNTSNGRVISKSRRTYTDVFGAALVKIARKDPRVVAITAAMPDGTGLTRFSRKFPGRFFNVGIAEEHAVTFAAGLASSGARPVVAIYSTFMQRAYDQIVHDVCLQNLPVVFALDRAGLVGEDGATHHGVFDLSYLRHIPNLTVMVPKDAEELINMLHTAVNMDSPVALRYPRGEAQRISRRFPVAGVTPGKAEILREGRDVAIIAVGTLVNSALAAASELDHRGIRARVINARFVKPLDEAAVLSAAAQCDALVLAEENVAQGGFSGAVLECLARHGPFDVPVEIVALPDDFISHGKTADLRALYGLNAQGLVNAVKAALSRAGRAFADRGEEIVIRQSI